MISPLVIVAVEHAVGQITLNRPGKRNALTAAMLQQILDGLDCFEHGGDVRVVLIRGAGAAFCSGLDLDDMKSAHERTGSFDFELLLEVFARLAHHPNPTIAMVHGVAIAGGCELALHCDLRIGSAFSSICNAARQIGVGHSWRCCGAVSPDRRPLAKCCSLVTRLTDYALREWVF